MERSKLLVILGSTRQGRLADKVAGWLMPLVNAHDEFDAELVDLRNYELPYYNSPKPPMMLAPEEKPAGWTELINGADAFIFVTPEYNHSFPAVLKSALDAIFTEWNRKPMAVVSYGGWSGGTRAAEQLRLVAVELQMAPVRNGVVMSFARTLFDEQGQLKDPERLGSAAGTMLDDLAWWSAALKAARVPA